MGFWFLAQTLLSVRLYPSASLICHHVLLVGTLLYSIFVEIKMFYFRSTLSTKCHNNFSRVKCVYFVVFFLCSFHFGINSIRFVCESQSVDSRNWYCMGNGRIWTLESALYIVRTELNVTINAKNLKLNLTKKYEISKMNIWIGNWCNVQQMFEYSVFGDKCYDFNSS